MAGVKNPYNILRTGDFDPSKLEVSVATPTKYKSLQSFINYPNSSSELGKVIYQTPIMRAPFGLTESRMTEDDDPKYYIDMSFNDTTDKLSGFHKKAHDLFKGIDKRMVDIAVERSSKWFKRKKTRQTIVDEKYKSVLKFNRDEEGNPKNDYPDRLSLKVLLGDNGVPNLTVFDHLKRPVEVKSVEELSDVLPPGSRLKAILQASSVWISSTGCGISWRLLSIKLYPSGEENLPGYAFESESSEIETLE